MDTKTNSCQDLRISIIAPNLSTGAFQWQLSVPWKDVEFWEQFSQIFLVVSILITPHGFYGKETIVLTILVLLRYFPDTNLKNIFRNNVHSISKTLVTVKKNIKQCSLKPKLINCKTTFSYLTVATPIVHICTFPSCAGRECLNFGITDRSFVILAQIAWKSKNMLSVFTP